MTRCDTIHNRLLALPDPTRLPAELADHLAGCDICTRYQARLLVLADDLRTLPAPDSDAAKADFLDHLTAAGPVIKTIPTLVRPARFDWHTLTKPVGGLAAAIAVGVGLWALISGKQVAVAEPPLARHELLQRVVAIDTDLSRLTDPKARVAKLTELAEAVHAETKAVHAAARGKDEMRSLAGMYQKVVADGIVAQARQINRFDPPAERQATLKQAASKLAAAAVETHQLANSPVAPPAARESLEEMARTAESGRAELLALAEGKAKP
jgi:hypothetical protein